MNSDSSQGEAKNSPPDPTVSALENVVDDLSGREDAMRWAAEQINSGLTVEQVIVELIANGWSAHQADEIAHEAFRGTRYQRGAMTRLDAARAYGVGAPTFDAFSALERSGGAGASLLSFLRSFRRLWTTRTLRKRK